MFINTMPTRTNSRIVRTPRHEIALRLREMAHERGPGAKLPTTRELSSLFSTSLPTLNAVLDELESVSVISRKDRSGLYVSPRLLCKNVAVVMDTRIVSTPGVSPFWFTLYAYCSREAQKRAVLFNEAHSFRMVEATPGPTNPLPAGIVEEIEQGKLHGVVSIGLESPVATPAYDEALPVVSFGGVGYCQVGFNQDELVRTGTRALCAQGCRRIELWRATNFGRGYSGVAPREENACREALAEIGAEKKSELAPVLLAVRDFHKQSLNGNALTNQDQGARIAEEVFSALRADWPDGVLILDDMMTSGVVFTLQKMGVRLNADVRIATHANRGSTVLYGHERELTLVEVDAEVIARELFRMLDGLMAGVPPEEPHIHIALGLREPATGA
jgi:DNA-binding LacI/PurR family transcriptional regulator